MNSRPDVVSWIGGRIRTDTPDHEFLGVGWATEDRGVVAVKAAPVPPKRQLGLADILEDAPIEDWFTDQETNRLLRMMTPLNRNKVTGATNLGSLMVGAIYKRTRPNKNGRRVQRAEVRFDDLSGCLRTPAGGSSRQVLLIVNGPVVRSRLISKRETARLMGLPDSYRLPTKYNEAYHLTGDGVVVPVVRHLASSLFEPILANLRSSAAA